MSDAFIDMNMTHKIPLYEDTEGISLSEEQEDVVEKVLDFINNGDKKYFVVSGYAGTGKSAVIPFIREKMSGDSSVVAYTGKAVVVLKRRGISDAQTLHSFLYNTRVVKDPETKKVRYEFLKKSEYDFEHIQCVFVDEASMVDELIFNELTSHKFKIVFFGDSFQLPPVKDNFNIMENPDVQLTKILRQNENDPIVKMSFLARTQQKIPFGEYGDSSKKIMFKFKMEKWNEYDQIICWTNRKRKEINDKIREIRGFSANEICMAEKMIVKQNYPRLGLYNGQMVYVNQQTVAEKYGNYGMIYPMTVIDEIALNDIIAAIDWTPVKVYGTVGWDAEKIYNYKIENATNKKRKMLVHFDFGYAITCHASQGSSWEKVCIIEEDGIRKRPEYWRWIYTAITRAEKSVTIFATGA